MTPCYLSVQTVTTGRLRWNQAQGHAQFANVVDYRMNAHGALEQPRFTNQTSQGCDVRMEETIPADIGQGAAVVRDSDREVNFAANSVYLGRTTHRLFFGSPVHPEGPLLKANSLLLRATSLLPISSEEC